MGTSVLAMLIFFTVLDAELLSVTNNSLLIEDLCPYSSFCSRIELADDESCCQKCSCDPNCHHVGTCCPGTPRVNRSEQITGPKYGCMYSQEVIDMARNINISSKQYVGSKYRIVNKCPDEKSSMQFPACENPILLSDFVFVSDLYGGLTYMNKHCANCHGANSTLDWNLFIESCAEILHMTFESGKQRNDYMLANCKIDVRDPGMPDIEKSVCYDERILISTCNVTWMWNVYDADIERECLKESPDENTIYYHPTIKQMLFANVYCYLCNIPTEEYATVGSNECNRTRTGGKIIQLSFAAVLGTDQLYADKPGTLCSSTSVWDPFTNACRFLYCAVGQMPVNGICERYELLGFLFQFYLEIVFNQVNFDFLENNWGYFEFYIYDAVLPGRECGLCQITLLSTYGSNDSILYYLSVDIYNADYCSVITILQYVKSLFIQGDIELFDETVDLSMKVIMDPPDDLHVVIGDHYRSTICKDPLLLQLTHLQVCPRFKIPRHEFEDLGFNITILETSNDLTVIYDQFTDNIHICVNKYMQIQESVTPSMAEKWASRLEFILSAALYVILQQHIVGIL